MASKKHKITLTQLLNDERWELCYNSEKYQYYYQHIAPGIWGDEIRKIKRSIIVNYLNYRKNNDLLWQLLIKDHTKYSGIKKIVSTHPHIKQTIKM